MDQKSVLIANCFLLTRTESKPEPNLQKKKFAEFESEPKHRFKQFDSLHFCTVLNEY